MKILIVNTYDRGGAANACVRLHKGLLQQGVDCKLLVLHKTKEIENSYQFTTSKQKVNQYAKLFKKVKNKISKKYKNVFLEEKVSSEDLFLKQREKGLELYSFPNATYDITTSKLYQEADVINLHWVAGFLDFETFFKTNKKPVIWTLHDMNPFTGGEHFEETHLGITPDGFPVQRKISSQEEMVHSRVMNSKIKALQDVKNLNFVSLCNWMSQEIAKKNEFANYPLYQIPNGISSKIFRPLDVNFSRELFNIPLGKKVILFVADSVTNERKGFIYLQRALEKLNRRDVLLCSMGKGKPILDTALDALHLGEIKDERVISAVYSMADVFVIPSLMDNLPNTVLESLLCGTPVIGFPIGGIPDMIDHGKNGLLTVEVSVDSLKESMESFLIHGVSSSREEIRIQAVKKYDQSLQARSYIKLFKETLINTAH